MTSKYDQWLTTQPPFIPIEYDNQKWADRAEEDFHWAAFDEIYLTTNPEMIDSEIVEYICGWDFRPLDKPRFEEVLAEHGLSDLVCADAPSGFVDGDDVTLCVMYWRKANTIHNWFVQTAQVGLDECQVAPVHVEQLAELLATCRKVVENPMEARNILPPTAGFFFGSTDTDEWYFQDVTSTIEALEAVLVKVMALPDRARYQFVYRSSW